MSWFKSVLDFSKFLGPGPVLKFSNLVGPGRFRSVDFQAKLYLVEFWNVKEVCETDLLSFKCHLWTTNRFAHFYKISNISKFFVFFLNIIWIMKISLFKIFKISFFEFCLFSLRNRLYKIGIITPKVMAPRVQTELQMRRISSRSYLRSSFTEAEPSRI